MYAGGSAPAGEMRAVRRAGALGCGAICGVLATTVIGVGMVAGFAVRGAAGFFRGAPATGARRAGTGTSAGGSSRTGTKAGVFGGEARRVKSSQRLEREFPL
jgi:hypothetical protein